jgi:subtilisin family serine protease
LYVVQLTEKPLASYDGGISGLKATTPKTGRKLDPKSAESTAYRNHLAKKRSDIAKAAEVTPITTFDTALNGFSAKLTAKQAAKLAAMPGVQKLFKNEMLHADTFTTPEFLGLSGTNGVWQQRLGGVGRAGEGVIIADVDSGYTPENPSFAPLPEPRPDAAIIASKTRGGDRVCEPGTDKPEKAAPIVCNNKVIVARSYRTGVAAIPEEFDSPRDYGGHGSHTASTAAGNTNVPAVVNGKEIGKISGMAPAARLAIYKVCWSTDYVGGNSCSSIDSAKAIDQAVLDGADVINFSISGSQTSAVSMVEIAFMNAAQAGVFVSASAGNAGTTSSVAHNAPWLTTVAASTHDRAFRKSVTLGNGKTFTGQGLGAGISSSPMIDSAGAGLPDAAPDSAELCFTGALDPAKVTGKIVLCRRGSNERTDKSNAVKVAGGVGMVLYNPTPNSLNADDHAVPTVHVDPDAGKEIKAYITAGNATASIGPAERYSARAPEMADFSSFGPALAGDGNLLKPDITAPGVDILAAVAPTPANNGQNFASYQGTSMSAPHITGIAALVKQAHPDWSPMAIKSALMTTASPKDNQGKPIQRLGKDATPLNFGSGHVVPMKAFDPGLVYDSGLDNWLSWICGIGQGAENPDLGLNCADFPKVDQSDLNMPSIAIGGLGGSQTVTRTVRNVTNQTGLYTAKIEAPAGAEMTVTPSRIILAPGKSATFKVKITRTTAPFDQYTFGALTWWDGKGHEVRSPIAVRPVSLVAPTATPIGTGTSGKVEFTVRTGFAGQLKTGTVGLVPATVKDIPLKSSEHSFDPTSPAAGESVGSIEVTVPDGSAFTRFATFDADYTPGTDIDLYVYKKVGNNLVIAGSSTNATAEESLTITDSGTYVLFIDLFGSTGNTVVKPHSWVVGSAEDNFTVATDSPMTTVGGTTTVTATWSGLETGRRYLGAVLFSDGTSTLARTTVRVDT